MDLFNYKEIIDLGIEPTKQEDFDVWIQQREIIPFLQNDAKDEHIIIYAFLPHVFIHAVLIPNVDLVEPTIKDLMKWSYNPFSSWGLTCSSNDAWIENPLSDAGSAFLRGGVQILFGRYFEGAEENKSYFELNQKISHLLGIHHIPERDAWCKLDKFGDIEDIVKITKINKLPNNKSGKIISIKKEVLGEYAGFENLSLLRMYDFTRYKSDNFYGWENDNKPTNFTDNNSIFGNLVVVPGVGSYSKGFQITHIGISKDQVVRNIWGGPTSDENKQYATFIAHDWKNKRISEISCDPTCLSNYFIESELPFGTTPAFFKPEVLSKYKSDREKYHLTDRSISSRGSWHLETFDVNSAGQVHTYLIYLGRLPYEEQLHWKQFNEKPKAPLSKRAITTDFDGQFYEEYDPLPSLKGKLEDLHRMNLGWWTLRNDNTLRKVHYPYTASRDEWAEEILNLDQLLIEGFEEKWLRNKVKELGRNPEKELRALKLIEECLIALGFEEDHAHQIMSHFHLVHNLRSILKGHTWGGEAEKVRKDALKDFGSFRNHFAQLCTDCDESIEIIIGAFKNID